MDSGTTNSHADVWESGTNDATDGTGKRDQRLNTPFLSLLFAKGFFDFTLVCFLNHGSPVAWCNTLEDWAAEDWTEDVSVGQTVCLYRYLFLYITRYLRALQLAAHC